MSDYCGPATKHTKKRGKIRLCAWCGQKIEIGERYAKWVCIDGGNRDTLYAHKECADALAEEAEDGYGIIYFEADNERPVSESPNKGKTEDRR